MDAGGRPYKVVKFATDVTAKVRAAQLMKQAVDGVVAAATANDLTRRIALDGMSGDTRALCEGLNALLDNMTSVIGQVKSASDTIALDRTSVVSGKSREVRVDLGGGRSVKKQTTKRNNVETK